MSQDLQPTYPTYPIYPRSLGLCAGPNGCKGPEGKAKNLAGYPHKLLGHVVVNMR